MKNFVENYVIKDWKDLSDWKQETPTKAGHRYRATLALGYLYNEMTSTN